VLVILIVGVLVGVMLIVGVKLFVRVIVGVLVGVILIVGVIVFVTLIVGVVVIEGVLDIVGVGVGGMLQAVFITTVTVELFATTNVLPFTYETPLTST